MNSPPFFVLYAGPRDIAAVCEVDDGFELMSCDAPDRCPELNRRPDLILMDPPLRSGGGAMDKHLALKWLGAFKARPFRFPPAFFSVVPKGTGMDVQVDLMEQGLDDVIEWPVSPRTLKLKSRCYVEKNVLQQSMDSKQASLDKAFGYLDRFKLELGQVKKDLADEKNSLNAALKQIQEMTRERHRLKTGSAALKKDSRRNLTGFKNILYTLIQHRVEKNRGHGERVARTALFIAKEMGFDEKKLEDLRKAAMLHEIGLLFLSESLLDSPFTRSGPDDSGPGAQGKDRGMEKRPSGPLAYDR